MPVRAPWHMQIFDTKFSAVSMERPRTSSIAGTVPYSGKVDPANHVSHAAASELLREIYRPSIVRTGKGSLTIHGAIALGHVFRSAQKLNFGAKRAILASRLI